MKKMLTSMFALAALLLANSSCSNQEWEENGVAGGNEVAVTFTAQLEDAAATRAIGDGTTATQLTFAVFKAGDGVMGNEISNLRQTLPVTGKKATINTTLVKGQTYNFVFWAQSPNATAIYDITDMSSIKVAYGTGVNDANDEDRDAFYALRKELKVTGAINETITLKRPFAQINVGANMGEYAKAKNADIELKYSTFTFNQAATALNTYTGAATGKVAVTFDKKDIPQNVATVDVFTVDAEGNTTLATGKTWVGDLKNVGEVSGNDYEYLAMNYILVADESIDGKSKSLVNGTFTVFDKDGVAINKFDLPNIPVQRNYRTNIIGSVLTAGATFNIVIDSGFDGDHSYDVVTGFENGGEFTLQQDVVLDAPLTLAAGKELGLNLNGYSIKTTKTTGATDAIVVAEGATLTIDGNGTVEAISGGDGFPVIAEGTVIINGGNFKSGKDANNKTNACIYARGKGKIEIYGGYFESFDGTFVLNKKDADRATTDIKVYGGTFVKFNPANNASEGANTNFVAEGYTSAQVGDNWIVAQGATVTTATDLATALNNTATDAPETVSMVTNVKATETLTMNGKTLNGNGNTLTMDLTQATGTLALGIQSNGGTVKDLAIKGNDQRNADGKGYRAIYIVNPQEDVVIENANISGVAYPMNTGTKTTKAGLKLTVKNSTLVGWTSFDGGLASASFTGCHFGIGTYYEDATNPAWDGCVKPYITTVFDGCSFEKGFTLDVSEIKDAETVTLKQCKVDGVVLTAANIATYIECDDITKVTFE